MMSLFFVLAPIRKFIFARLFRSTIVPHPKSPMPLS